MSHSSDLVSKVARPERINVQRLLQSLLLTLVGPLVLLVLLDFTLGWRPWLTIGGSIIFIPLSTWVVMRATLAEMDRVMQAIAPLEPVAEPVFPPTQELRAQEPIERAPTNH